MLDMRPDHLKILQALLKKHVPDIAVWAFGSRVFANQKKLAKKYSDLDLCIVSETPLSMKILSDLNADCSESDLPYKVDIIDWASASASFKKTINEKKLLLPSISSNE